MKRVDFIRHLEVCGCALLREGGNHSVYVNRVARKVCEILADAYIAEHIKDNQPPTREMFERLGARRFNGFECLTLGTLVWNDGDDLPLFCVATCIITIDTVSKLKAACLLLNIEWKQ